MPFDPTTQSRQGTGEFGYRIFQKDEIDISNGDDKQLVSDLARIGTNTHISNSTIADATIRDGAKIINSNVGNDTNVGSNTLVFGSDLAESNEIGADSSILSSKLDLNRGHIELHDHVSITASEIGASVFVDQYTSIQSSTIGKLCEFAGHSLIANSEIGDDSQFGELCDIQGVSIAGGARIGHDVAIMQDCVLMSKVQIGEGTRIANHVELADDVAVRRNVIIKRMSKIGRNVMIQDGVVIGAEVVIGEGAVLCKGCIVEDGAHVPAGTTVQSGETFYNRT